jgi:hypothetical protein
MQAMLPASPSGTQLGRTPKPTTYEGPVLQFSHLARKFVPDGKGKKAIELGAIPGNHLVHFHKEFGSTSLR